MSKVVAASNVRVLGSGETTIVLGHGFGWSQSVWRHLVPLLVDHYKVLLYDNMGSGTTNPDHYDFDRYATLQGYADDLIAILDEFNVRQCIFIGHSIAPLAALIASISRPDLFQKLILLSTTPRMSNTADYKGGSDADGLEQTRHGLEKNREALITVLAPLMLGISDDNELSDELIGSVLSMRADIMLSALRAAHSYDVRPLLPRVTVPCHIIQSSEDVGVPLAAAEYYRQHLGGKSIVEVLPLKGHVPQLTAPGMTNQVLLRHVHDDIK